MAFADLSWQSVSPFEIVSAFLKAERHKLRPAHGAIIDADDFDNSGSNQARTELLYSIRGALLDPIPWDTRWFRVSTMTMAELPQLRVIGRCGWDNEGDANELGDVARRKPIDLTAAEWSPIILWGHDKDGPFSILEGNHRLVSYSGHQNPPPLQLTVFVGLSYWPCFWHSPDPFWVDQTTSS